MVALATEHGTAYMVGQLGAIVLLAALAIGLGLRALDLRGRRARSAAPAPVPFAPLAPAVSAASVAPPGWVEPSTPSPTMTAVAARLGRSRRARTTDALAGLVAGLLLVAALVHFIGAQTGSGPWDTPQGRGLHAAFLIGCDHGGALDCKCVFQRLTSGPPYDTPAGFATLQRPMATFVRTGDVSAVPQQFVAAVRACISG
jgi:hypothetical protein